eukprot:3934877-Rhodomonas_salina.1
MDIVPPLPELYARKLTHWRLTLTLCRQKLDEVFRNDGGEREITLSDFLAQVLNRISVISRCVEGSLDF